MELPVLNKYELMWIFVFFDLPVVEKKERKDATKFRNLLLDNGFNMVQYSIYTRLFSGKDACKKYYRLIQDNLPKEGKVDILTVTDAQYSNIISFNARKKQEKNKKKNLKTSFFYSEFLQKKIHSTQLISLYNKKLHWMYYNWLNFPVNLQSIYNF